MEGDIKIADSGSVCLVGCWNLGIRENGFATERNGTC